MCVERRYIINAIGQQLCVPCGHCKSCQQEKAMKRTIKIKSNYGSSRYFEPIVAYFVTLTYRNACVPYIDMKEVSKQPSYFDNLVASGKSIPSDQSDFKVVNLYRNYETRWVRSKNSKAGNYVIKRSSKPCKHIISKVVLNLAQLEKSKLMYLQNQKMQKVGVCYYPDVQNFVKRLRMILHRNYGFYYNFSSYQCSEYGPTTQRPHFHLLIFAPMSAYELLKRAVAKAWSYDNYKRASESVEVARNCSSYVASYVNCLSSVPPVFRLSDEARPRHSYSKGFGVADKCFSLPSLVEAFRCGDMHFTTSRIKGETAVVDRVLFPSYVVSRYFRKFKGYCKVNVNEIESICRDPESLFYYKRMLGYNDYDLHSNVVMLNNLRKRFCAYGYNVFDFAYIYARIWSLYSSNVLGDFYNNIYLPNENFTAYDNIKQFFSNEVMSPSLDDCFLEYSPPNLETDFNKFPSFVSQTKKYEYWFDIYSKDRKIRNYAYSRAGFNM